VKAVTFWADQRVIVTGGAGFLGSFVVKKLKEEGCQNIFVPRSKEYDLVNREACRELYKGTKPDLVIHLAAVVGGIGINQDNPGTFFYRNLMMGVHMMEEGRLFGAKKFVALGTVCAYPKYTPVPFKEEDLWNGYPEETNAPYGLAKKMMLVQSQGYRRQFGFHSIFLLPANLYGPEDNFDPYSSHVIPALIKKCMDALEMKRDEIVVWGTGNPSREFLYAEDCAEAIVLAAEKYDKPDPINIGTGQEISIKELVFTICRILGFRGRVVWDVTKPDGQPRRCLDVSKAEKEFGFKAKVGLEEGLRRTMDWYKRERGR